MIGWCKPGIFNLFWRELDGMEYYHSQRKLVVTRGMPSKLLSGEKIQLKYVTYSTSWWSQNITFKTHGNIISNRSWIRVVYLAIFLKKQVDRRIGTAHLKFVLFLYSLHYCDYLASQLVNSWFLWLTLVKSELFFFCWIYKKYFYPDLLIYCWIYTA